MTIDAGSLDVPLGPHGDEPHDEGINARLNWLRAGVLGANDGIVSVAAIVVGVAGVTTDSGPILIAGAAGVVGGAISMALGEYVSVSSQKDSQEALIEKERRELAEQPEELTAHDALGAHLAAELNIDETDIVSPWHAALASAIAFLAGAILPMLAILLPPENIRVPLTFAAVLVALAVTGAVGAWIGGGSKAKAAIRVVIGGAAALLATFLIGNWLGTSGFAG
jgi:VIT1/CCC1 family predicted Fe2+/Mn2+ transporter